MSAEAGQGLAGAVRSALHAPAGAALARTMHAPTVTAIVADAADAASLAHVLPPVLDAFAAAGVPRGRAFVLMAGTRDPQADALAARTLRAALGIPVIAHDRERSASFTLGRTPAGASVEIDDELREAEAVVVLASVTPGDSAARAAGLLWPGLASAPAARAHEALPAGEREREATAVAALVGVDFGVAWCGGAAPRGWAGARLGAFEAAANAFAVLDPPRGRT